MKEFAEDQGVVILTPIFPAGLVDPDDLHNFKFIEYEGIRFDRMLLAIVDEVAARFPVAAERFYLHGFSGGGQFTHRFLYLHPEHPRRRVDRRAGRITQLDETLPWWLGTKGFEEKFGQSIDFDALRRVPIQLVVGSEDVETWEIINRGESNWMAGAELTGTTRIERLRTLEANYRSRRPRHHLRRGRGRRPFRPQDPPHRRTLLHRPAEEPVSPSTWAGSRAGETQVREDGEDAAVAASSSVMPSLPNREVVYLLMALSLRKSRWPMAWLDSPRP